MAHLLSASAGKTVIRGYLNGTRDSEPYRTPLACTGLAPVFSLDGERGQDAHRSYFEDLPPGADLRQEWRSQRAAVTARARLMDCSTISNPASSEKAAMSC